MATYNGEAWIEEQVASVLTQLGEQDELVIVDDASTDSTVELLQALDDTRIRIFPRQRNLGYVATFEESLRRARGKYLLLCDQDDVWAPNHVTVLVEALGQSVVAATNLATLGGPPALTGPYGQQDWQLTDAQSGQNRRNVLGILAGNRPYYGCAMGVRASARDEGLLPFPDFLNESHDLWIALYGNLRRSICHKEARTVLRRFHGDNQTPNRPRGLVTVLGSRWLLLRCLGELRRRGVTRDEGDL